MIRALEFFSGIGGMHYGLNACDINAQVVEAFEISPVANECYNHNFKRKPSQKSIESLSVDYIEKLNANCWLLSPPCQPYTRSGKKMDIKDHRAAGLTFLISILPFLKNAPKYLFLENVVGFEHSESRKLLIECLVKMNYDFKEWHLSPVQFGIPNERPRYYLTATLSSLIKDSPDMEFQASDPLIITQFTQNSFHAQPIKEFLDKDDSSVISLPISLLKSRKFISISEISTPSDTRSKCFTKAYGHHGLHSGCFLMTKKVDINSLNSILQDPVQASESLGLRMFSPAEISRLHMFPKDFEFPPNISTQQQWKLLGNSMNILVVSKLLADLFKCNLR